MSPEELLSEEAFEKKQEYEDARSKRTGYLASGLVLLVALVMYIYFLHSVVKTFKMIMVGVFLGVIITAFLYGSYSKNKLVDEKKEEFEELKKG